ncbi:MAG: RnfABCDGE type electron transport complex subunit D [Cardiobacteriaceae bacterium]|nr:RnfABCDGE type electron transport complex subunit D [Cardiobacteriaceae bacterium]
MSQDFPPYKSPISTANLMWLTILALLPGMMVILFFRGICFVAMLAVAIISAICAELLVLTLRRRLSQFSRTLSDGSLFLSAILLVICLPANAANWLIVVGVFIAIILGRELYGGLGGNPFNPAMLAFAILLIGFPAQMSAQISIDGTTAATILDASRQMRLAGEKISISFATWQSLILTCVWILGGSFLLKIKVIDAKITFSVLISAFFCAVLFYLFAPERFLSPLAHILSGALIFGAFFIATDPVTAATSPKGRIIYGAIIGVLTVCIRNLGAFPDGFAFSVLLANTVTVYLDRLRPKYK